MYYPYFKTLEKRLSYRVFPNNSVILASTNLPTFASNIKDKSSFGLSVAFWASTVDTFFL